MHGMYKTESLYGKISYTPADYGLGTVATYSCKYGFRLEGGANRSCVEMGSMLKQTFVSLKLEE